MTTYIPFQMLERVLDIVQNGKIYPKLYLENIFYRIKMFKTSRICFRLIKRHENDAMSVNILVGEIQQEPSDPILI